MGIAIGFVADRLFGDPRRGHPVAGFGMTAAALERRTYTDSTIRGAAHVATLVATPAALGIVAERAGRPGRLAATAVCTWAVLGGRSLTEEAAAVGNFLASDDLSAARVRLTHLVGRDTTSLSPDEIARAVVESVAENTSDAVVAPLFWGALFGVPGLVGYRAANTLDAMIGHHNARYEHFGKAAARLDDLLNWVPARLSGLLVAACTPRRAADVVGTWRRDAGGHPSPNAGVVESAFAGALGVQLGGTNDYHGRIEHRALMGSGRAPVVSDIATSTALAGRVGVLAAALAVAAALLPGLTRRK